MIFDVARIAKYLMDNGAFYPDNGVGIGRISKSLGITPGRVKRGLGFLRFLGLVSRNVDPRRRKYSTWSISKIASILGDVGGIINFLWGNIVERGDLAFYEWIDFFLDDYFLSGTAGLLLNGLSWNDVMPFGVLLVMDRSKYNWFRKFYRFYRRTCLAERYRIDVVFVSDIEDCDYRIVRMENSAVPLASVDQALVDSIINHDSWGVDLLETLSVLVGIVLPQVFETKDWGRIENMVYLAEKQYDSEKFVLLVAILRNILMRYYIYFEETDALELYMVLPEVPENYTIPQKISRKIYEAFRATILGDRVAMYLGLEPDFSKTATSTIDSSILAVSEI